MKMLVKKLDGVLGITFPPTVVEAAGLVENSEVDVSVIDGEVTTFLRRKPKYTLEEMCAGITPENRHPETDWGPDVGKEIVE